MNFLHDAATGRLGGLALGAVQLGLPYGIANRTGKPDEATAFAILDAAARNGVRVLDTAQAYGDSEALIGRHRITKSFSPFHVISKLNPGCDYRDRAAVLAAAAHSADLVGAPLASLLMHDPAQLKYWNEGAGEALLACVAAGHAASVGVSIYTPEEFDLALSIPEVRVIQAPFNALDRRLLFSGVLKRALASGKVVLLRSILLQGMLLMEQDAIPDRVAEARPLIAAWWTLCREAGLPPLTVAIKYAQQRVPGAILLMGSETPEQVDANAALVEASPLPESLLSAVDGLPLPLEKIVNPSLWSK